MRFDSAIDCPMEYKEFHYGVSKFEYVLCRTLSFSITVNVLLYLVSVSITPLVPLCHVPKNGV